MRTTWAVWAILGTGCAVAAAWQDDEAQKAYDSLFGAQAKQVLATPTSDDDVELAGKLLEAAAKDGDPADLRVLLCQKACEFAAKSADGCGLIVESMRLMGRISPGRRLEGLDRAVGALEGLGPAASKPEDRTTVAFHMVGMVLGQADALLEANRPADSEAALRRAMSVASSHELPTAAEVQFRIEKARAAKALAARLGQAQAALKSAPTNQAAARRLGMLYLLEADDPARAAQHLRDSGAEPTWIENATLAAKDLNDLDEETCWKLARWYKGLAGQAGPLGKLAILERGQAYCQRLLALHSQEDAKRTVALDTSRELALDLGRARAELSGGWIDLLALVRPELDLVSQVPWKVTEQGLLSPGGHSDLMLIPFEPPRDYDLLACFTCKTRPGPVGFVLPFGDRQVTCVLGEINNTRSGLAEVNTLGVENPNNPAARNLGLTAERTYCLHAQVRNGRIRVSLNRQVVVDLATDGTNLRNPIRWTLPSTRALGFGTSRTAKSIFHCVSLRELSGRGRLAILSPART